MSEATSPLSLLAHPYSRLVPFTGSAEHLRSQGRQRGTALVWTMADGVQPACSELVGGRPGGLSLLIILPPGERITSDSNVMHLVQRSRPHGILPYHLHPAASELAQVLRRPPADLAAEVTDYLTWRGLGVDRETAHVLRRIIDLSVELQSVSALSRSLYLSRRALGRRLMTRGLPVPSHWLQIGRLLRVAIKLQNSDATISSIAYEFGYPDAFSVSNQMLRIVGCRPSTARERLGWEWLIEAWLRGEAEGGGLTPTIAGEIRAGAP